MTKTLALINFITNRFYGSTIDRRQLELAIKDFEEVDDDSKN